jgi:hypothetical protein
MKPSYEHGPFYSTPESSPSVVVELDQQRYLELDNTVVRTFDEGDGDYDHFLHRTPENKILFMFFSHPKCPPDLKDWFMENGFDHTPQELDELTANMYLSFITGKTFNDKELL